MAKIVSALPIARYGKPASYPWDDWLDGKVWELVRGEDFSNDPQHFRATALQAAARRQVQLETRVTGDRVYIQARA